MFHFICLIFRGKSFPFFWWEGEGKHILLSFKYLLKFFLKNRGWDLCRKQTWLLGVSGGRDKLGDGG